MPDKATLNSITDAIIGCAIEVHKTLGPGLLESAYEACLAYELVERGHQVETEKPLPLTYKGVHLDCGYRLDLLVDGQVIVEAKVVDQLNRVHEAQLMSYLKLTGCRVGLLINFNVVVLKNGLRRVVLGFKE